MKKPATRAGVFVVSLVSTVVQFGLAIIAFGGWAAFFSHPALIALALVTLLLMSVAPLTRGNLSAGEKEDRGNRWVLTAFSLIALASAFVPAYTDRVGLWTIDGDTTRWVGVILYALGGFENSRNRSGETSLHFLLHSGEWNGGEPTQPRPAATTERSFVSQLGRK